MSAVFTAELYLDPPTGRHYVVLFAWGQIERDTNAAEADATEYAGPLTAAQVADVLRSHYTENLEWHDALPDEWSRWVEVERIWTDLGGGEP